MWLAVVFVLTSFCGVFLDCSINLDQLQNPDEAVRIVRATQSTDGAKMVAK